MPVCSTRFDAAPERIVVIGSGGSGKSTLADRIAASIGGRHVEIDALAFEGRLEHVSFRVLHDRLRQALDTPRWVLEGMHRDEIRRFGLPACQLVIWLDPPRRVVAFRLLRRFLRHAVRRIERHGRRIGWADLAQEVRFMAKTLRKYDQRRSYARVLLAEANDLAVSTLTARTRADVRECLKLWTLPVK